MKRSYALAFLIALLASPLSAFQTGTQTPNPLIEQLRSPDDAKRAKAARQIGASGDTSAVPALAAALKDTSAKVRREVVFALASIHTRDSLAALITATRDTESDVRVLAVQSVVGYYTGQVPSPGFTGMVKKEFRRAKSHFQADKTQVDPGTPVDPKAIASLQMVMNDTLSDRASREAAKGLGILLARSAVPDLVKGAHSSDEELARQALSALSKIKDRSAGPRLIDLLNSHNKEIKRDAAVTIGVLRTREALPKLQSMLENDPDQKDKEKAIEGLAYLGDSVSIPLFTKSLWDPNSKEIRIFAAEGLARAADPKTLPELQKAVVAEKDASVKLAIEFAITALGKDDYLSAIITDLGSKMRGDASEAYLVELSRNTKFLPKLYPYLSSQEATVRRRLCKVLIYTGDTTSLEALDRLSHDPNGDVATTALRAKQAIRARAGAS